MRPAIGRFVLFISLCAYSQAAVVLQVGTSNGAVPFPHSNGRQIGRNQSGIWFMSYDGNIQDSGHIFLASSTTTEPELAGDFYDAVVVVGPSSQALIRSHSSVRAASLIVDQKDVLHLLWETSDPSAIYYSQCHVAGINPAKSLGDRKAWTQGDGRTPGAERVDQGQSANLGDLSLDGEGTLWVFYSQSTTVEDGFQYRFRDGAQEYDYRGEGQAHQVWAATPSQGRWK